MIIKVTPDLCYNDCIYVEGQYILIKNPDEWKKKKVLQIGPYKIPKKKISTFYLNTFVRPGERKVLLYLNDDKEKVYLEYPSENRIYLDYDRYVEIYTFMTTLGIHKLSLDGITYYKYPSFDIIDNDFNQRFNDRGIIIYKWRTIKEPFYVNGKVIYLEIKDNVTIDKGECRTFVNSNITLCYGDPE